MKLARCALKIAAAALAFAGAVCLIAVFWDQLTENCSCCKEKIIAKVKKPVEYDDFADVP